MNCPLKQEWTLFYYRDLEQSRLDVLKAHLKECTQCRQAYEGLSGFLSSIKKEPVSLSQEELSTIVDRVEQEAKGTGGIFEELKQKSGSLFQGLRLKLFYQPRLIPVAVALLLLTIFLPIHRQQVLFERAVFDLEMELVSGEDEFDLLLDLYTFPESS